MISRDMIKYIAGERTFSRGASVYKMNRVKSFDIQKGMDMMEKISAVVKGSMNSEYNVRIDIDTVYDEVADSYCECPAFESFGGLCKHCVAVLLEYRDTVGVQMSFDAYLESQRKKNASAKMIKKGLGKDTTKEIKDLLYARARRNTLPVLEFDTYGKIRLEPHLTVNRESIGLAFKIGVKKMYVLKDVFDFADKMSRSEKHSYGKNLEFLHCMESFEDESKPLVEFVMDWVEYNRESYKQPVYGRYYYEYSLPKLRHIPLDSSSLQRFLDIVGDNDIYVTDNYGDEILCHIVRDESRIPLTIKGGDDGVDMTLGIINGVYSDKYFVQFEDGLIKLSDKADMKQVEDFVKCFSNLPNRKAHISKEDVPAFCRDMLPVLKEKFQCNIKDFDEIDYDIIKPEISVYIDMPQEGMIVCNGKCDYGDNEYQLYDRETDIWKRDMTEETKVGSIIASYCNSYDEINKCMVLTSELPDYEDRLFGFVSEGINAVQEIADVYVSDNLKKINVVSAPSASVGVSLAGDLLELKINSNTMPLDMLAEILSKYNRKKKYFRLKNGDFVRTGDGSFDDMVQMTRSLQLTAKQIKEGSAVIPKYRALFIDSQMKESISVKTDKDKNFKALIRNMKTIEDNDYDIPRELDGVLRSYQKYGFMWIKTLCHNGFGGILADDMGLGKTLQIIAFLKSEYAENESGEKRSIIICPASLVYNWKYEIDRFAPELPVKMVIGNADNRKMVINNMEERVIVVTSYDLLRRDIDLYENIHFFCQVIDEAQYIKNHNTQSSRAVKAVKSGFRMALTGTPVENRLSELHSIFDYLMPGFLYSYKRFREELEVPIVTEGDEYAMERLRKMINPFVLRRLKKDVLKDLPDKIENNMYFEMEGEQAELYEAHVQRIKLMLDNSSDEEFKNSKIQILAELTKLRQLCCDPGLLYEDYHSESGKIDMCMHIVDDAAASGHKILLFSQFTTMLERLEEALKDKGISYYTLTGATPKEKRIEMVENFNKDDVSVFCISLKAGGTGLNLTAADIVIHFDPWWNVAVQNQATDRAHRIGQKKVVNVYKLIAKNSIEENIVKLQERKNELADSILGGEGIGSGSFSKEELLQLLQY